MAISAGNRKGSSSVFLCMVMSSVLLLVGILGHAAAGTASRSYVYSVFDLAGCSVLSEYDRALKTRYGIFGFSMEGEDVEELFCSYAEKSFTDRDGKINLLPLKIEDIKVDISEYSLTNPDLLEGQIIEHMSYRIVQKSLKILEALAALKDKDTQEPGEKSPEARRGRTLRSGKVIDELPSRLLQGAGGRLINIPDLPLPGEMGRIAYNQLCLNLYILEYFRHGLDDNGSEDTFFFNEIEYIICGRLSDEANRNIVYLSLLAFRTLVNAAHIYSDEIKWEAVTAAAVLAGGGVATVAAQAAIALIWAGAEAAIDMSRLEKGGRVPLIKTADDWRLDLSKALEGDTENNGLQNEDNDGLCYEDYLFLLLCFTDREGKLIRCMDLIQLNMKGLYNEYFNMSRCKAGFAYESKVLRKAVFPGIFHFQNGEFLGQHVY